MIHEVVFTLYQTMELFVIVIFFTAIDAQESQLEGPQNTLNDVSSTVTLKCSSSSRNCDGIDWQKYIPGASPMTVFKGPRQILNVVDRDRYSVDNSSGCDLIIRNVQLTDAGRFVCSTIMSISQVTKTAHLIVLETQPKCALNVSLNDTVEGDGVQLKCKVTYNGTNGVRLSMNWKGVPDAPAAVYNGNTISRNYSVVASAPEVPSFICETSFALETNGPHGAPIGGLATNSIPNVNCSTAAIKVLYSVRNVALSPSLSYYAPKTIITCTAMGHPSPTFKWQEMENGSTWTDIQNYNGNEFTMTDDSSKRYRCVAMNVVRGRSYNATSIEIPVNKSESATPKEDAGTSLLYILMAVAAGILLIIIVIIICFCNETCPGYKCYNSGKKSKDNLRVEQTLRENPDVCIYSAVNKGQDSHPKAKSPKRPKGPPPQPKASYADVYQNEECTYADLAMEYGPRKVVPQNGQAAQEESIYADVSKA